MISRENIKYSLNNLIHRKTRSLLTILSIFVGITTIFIFISFGWGLYDYVNDLSTSSSADKILIQAKGASAPGMDETFKLQDKDVKVVENTIGVYEATGVYFRPAEVKQGKLTKYTFLIAYDPKKPMVMDSFNVDIYKGRGLSDKDSGKAVLGYNYQFPDKIFPKPYRVNDLIEVEGKKLRIIGFMGEVGTPQDDSQIYVITDYMQEIYPDKELSYGMIIARVDIKNMKDTIDRVEKKLRKSRNLEEGKEDFYVTSYEDLLNSYMVALNVVIGFIILIALISVVVSAVNTANTMVTSVLERVKEIGVIKSIGATNLEIFNIFLFESSFLGFVAGVIGIFFGWLFTTITAAILNNLSWGFLSPHYSWSLFLGCIAFATLTGAISGVAPAVNASKLKPVDALRYE